MKQHPLYQWRVTQDLSQAEAAEKIGVSDMAWSRWERGKACPVGTSLLALMRLTGIAPEKLMGL